MLTAPPFTIHAPYGEPAPLVVDSPHSGFTWPAHIRVAAPLSALRTTWDAYVDELWGSAPHVGAALLVANVPRALIDLNRAESDLDAALLADEWPEPLVSTPYGARGMGLVRRFALPDVPMYDAPLAVADVQERIRLVYRPYRAALRSLLDRSHEQHGGVCHLNVHSMKSVGNAMNVDVGRKRPDVVVSDRHGTTANPTVARWIHDWFGAQGLLVSLNTPYQGGDLVATFGQPNLKRHSVQIEFNRALYLEETTVARGAAFGDVQRLCTDLLHDLASAAVGWCQA